MKERTLLKLSLVCSIVGIFALFVICDNIDIGESEISALDGMVGESAVITGVVSRVSEFNETTFIEIAQETTVDVVMFERVPGIQVGSLVQVRGKVDEYQGESEILADEVRVIG